MMSWGFVIVNNSLKKCKQQFVFRMASSNLNDYVNEVCKALDYREGVKVSFNALNLPYNFFYLFIFKNSRSP
jgi:hypothetical protein